MHGPFIMNVSPKHLQGLITKTGWQTSWYGFFKQPRCDQLSNQLPALHYLGHNYSRKMKRYETLTTVLNNLW